MVDLPKIYLGRDALSDFNRAIQTEWLVTNGLGGYASSTVLGINTRKYHGLLVAALNPPVNRTVFLTKLDEEIQTGNRNYQLGSNEFKHDIHPKGYRFLQDFWVGPFPNYRYVVQDVEVYKTILMPYRKNAVVVIYEVLNRQEKETSIRIFPLVNLRHFYSVTSENDATRNFAQEPKQKEVTIRFGTPQTVLIISSSHGKYLENEGKWVENIYFRTDNSLGESCFDANLQLGRFEVNIAASRKEKFFVVATAGNTEKETRTTLSSIIKELEKDNILLHQQIERQKNVLANFRKQHKKIWMSDWLKWIIMATDPFVVQRKSIKTASVIAGYHWFEDYGRDTFISLPGLTLITGKFKEAKEILLTFKHYCHKGIIPNRFPDHLGDKPAYNTVDATLWYFNAVLQYLKYTSDWNFVREKLWKTLKSIVDHHAKGTLYEIRLSDDGLITHGAQLTWMDAVVNGQPVTPRNGKAVEIQALWYNALKIMALLAERFRQTDDAKKCLRMAERAKESFLKNFWNPKQGCLFDVVKADQYDSSLRPNQLIAVALDFSMLDKAKSESIVQVVWRKLWGAYGLRTLAENDPQYKGRYVGDWEHRNKAYHNGTVWPWLLGPFITAFLKVKDYRQEWRKFAFKEFLQPLFITQIFQAGLGTVSEIFDADDPNQPRGCIAQAWSVAEPLRAFVEDVMLERPPYEQQVLKTLPSH
jgi:predicted glycogen debranching enzyme